METRGRKRETIANKVGGAIDDRVGHTAGNMLGDWAENKVGGTKRRFTSGYVQTRSCLTNCHPKVGPPTTLRHR